MSHTIRRRHTHKPHHHRRKPRRRVVERACEPQPQTRRAPVPEVVSDHAVLRWLERVTGIDVASQVRAQILADGRDRLIEEVGHGKIHVAGTNAVLRVVNGRVVTVIAKGAAND